MHVRPWSGREHFTCRLQKPGTVLALDVNAASDCVHAVESDWLFTWTLTLLNAHLISFIGRWACLLFYSSLCVFLVAFLLSWTGLVSALIYQVQTVRESGQASGAILLLSFMLSVRSWCCSRVDGCAGGAAGVGTGPAGFLWCLWV